MNLEELEQVRKDLADGIIVSKGTWMRVLDAAIENAEKINGLRKNKVPSVGLMMAREQERILKELGLL